jgi:OmpA-OmpF porin, OOP family
MKQIALAALLATFSMSLTALASQDVENCKDHPLFNRLPGFYITHCESSQFDLRRFPKGPLVERAGETSAAAVDVEGPVWKIGYELQDGATKPSPLQIMRNFQNATRRGGGTIEGEYPGWCEGMLDQSLNVGNGCTHYGVSMRFSRSGREVWAYAQARGNGEGYDLVIAEREPMKQDLVANDLLDKIEKEGFVALYINFDTGKATIKPDSNAILDDVASALTTAPALRLEVAGHTDNVGTAEANQKLSEDRARAVVAALVARGIAAPRLSAKGYGQSSPVADNRSEDGRAQNRRVELVKLQ